MLLLNKFKTLPVAHMRQSHAMCGPASLSILLSHFGKRYTERELAKLCSSTKKHGTEHEGLIRGAKAAGAFVFAKEGGTLKDVEYFIQQEKLPVLVGWFNHDEGHYSVVIGITKKHLIIADPWAPWRKRYIKRKLFPSIWFNFVGSERKTVSWGWYMAVAFDRRRFKVKDGRYY